MQDKKKKRKQTAALIGGAFVLGCIGYWYYSSSQNQTNETDRKEEQQDESNKIEQITYAGDYNIDDIQQIKNNDTILEESKEVEEEPLINDAIVDKTDEDGVKDTPQTEQKSQAIAQQKDTESDKSNSPKEESPVMVHKADEDSEPIMVNTEEKEEKNEGESQLKALIKKYDGIVDRVSTFKKLQYKNGTLQIKLIKATDIDKDIDEKLKGLVMMELSNGKETSNVKEVGRNMEWNEDFVMDVKDTLKDVLVLRLMEHEEKREDREIGNVQINVIDVVGSEDLCIANRGFDVIGSKSGAKLYLNLMYSEDTVHA